MTEQEKQESGAQGGQSSDDSSHNGIENESLPHRQVTTDQDIEAPIQSDPVVNQTNMALQDGTSPNSEQRRNRLLISAAIAIVLIVLLVVGALVAKDFQDKAEEREIAITAIEGAASDLEASKRQLREVVTAAQAYSGSLGPDSVLDESILDEFTVEINEAEGSYNDSLTTKMSQLEPLSTEEISNEGTDLKRLGKKLDVISMRLDSFILKVNEAVDEKAAADEEARIQAEIASKKAAAPTITFDELARGGDSLISNYYRFEGKVIQDAGSNLYRVSITQDPGYSRIFWEDPILVNITGETSQRLLEDDIISFVAMSGGLHSYESIFGQSINLPLVLADGGDVAVIGHD